MPGRFLTPTESATEVLTRQQGTLNILTISCLRGSLDRQRFQNALTVLQAQHPHLQSRILPGLGGYCLRYGGASPIPWRIIPLTEETQPQAQLDAAIDHELNTPIASQTCLMRCVLLWSPPPGNLHYLLTTIHHGIADGLSAIYLQQAILTIYAQRPSPAPTLPRSTARLYSTADCLPSELCGISGIVKTLSYFPQFLTQRLQHLDRFPTQQWVPVSERRCGWLRKTLSPTQTQALVQQSRQEQTTMQGVLCAALLQTMAKQLIHTGKTSLGVACSSFVDLRKRGEPHRVPSELGMFAGFIPSFHHLTRDSDIWAIARDVHQQLRQGLAQQVMFKTLGMSGWVIEQELYSPDQLNFPLNVTNVGQLNLPSQYGELELEDIAFLPSNSILSGSILVAVTTYRDRMVLYFAASMPSIQPASLANFSQQVMQTLQMYSA
ncbi:MAG: condensation domain-containing protein [Cyanobacteria bacterium P01_G01_bin.54]